MKYYAQRNVGLKNLPLIGFRYSQLINFKHVSLNQILTLQLI